MPNTLDRFINEGSDNEGIYWIQKKGHEEWLVDILQGKNVIHKLET